MLTITSRETVYIKAPVAARIAGVVADPTSDTVAMAFVRAGAVPTDDDYIGASWETEADSTTVTYLARRLATELAPGRYDVWVQVERSPETIERLSGPLVVT